MKENKKNGLFVRLTGLLVLACILTACFVGGTMAKYTTSGSGEDSATVAKWGVTVTASDQDALFAKTYDIKDSATDASSAAITQSVVAAADTVAPGTSGTMARFDITGTPEVAVNVKFTGALTLTNWEVDGTYYCPIVITVEGVAISGATYDNKEAFENAVKTEIEKFDKNYQAGTNLATALENDNTLNISWAWAFEGNDVKDTALGSADTLATISLSVTATVTQID